MNFWRIPGWSLLPTLIILLPVSNGRSQSATDGERLDDSERASIMFDFKLNRIRDHAVLKDLKLEEMINQAQVQAASSPAMELQKLNRIFGGSQFPNDSDALQAQPGDPVNYEFFVRLEFADSNSADAMMQQYREQGGSEQEIDGKSYWIAENELTPANIKIHRVNAITVEMGTDRYVFNPDRNVVSTSLAGHWKGVPRRAALRFCVDLQNNREVINQVIEQMRTTVPPSVEPFLSLIDELASLSFAVDLESSPLVVVRAASNDTEGAEKLRAGIDGILGMGRLVGQQNLNQANWDDETRRVFEALLSSLKASMDGQAVLVEIAKPEGFDKVVAGLIGQLGPQSER